MPISSQGTALKMPVFIAFQTIKNINTYRTPASPFSADYESIQ